MDLNMEKHLTKLYSTLTARRKHGQIRQMLHKQNDQEICTTWENSEEFSVELSGLRLQIGLVICLDLCTCPIPIYHQTDIFCHLLVNGPVRKSNVNLLKKHTPKTTVIDVLWSISRHHSKHILVLFRQNNGVHAVRTTWCCRALLCKTYVRLKMKFSKNNLLLLGLFILTCQERCRNVQTVCLGWSSVHISME